VKQTYGRRQKVTLGEVTSSLMTPNLRHDSGERINYLLYYTQMESSPRGVGDWRPLHVRQALSGGSVTLYGSGKDWNAYPHNRDITLFP